MGLKLIGARQQQYLCRKRLRFSTKKTTDSRWHFKLDAFAPVGFEFVLDAERAAIRLRITNHERLGVLKFTYDSEDINWMFLDERAKYVMRKSSRFHELSGDAVPEDTLQRLRNQMAACQAERENEGREPAWVLAK